MVDGDLLLTGITVQELQKPRMPRLVCPMELKFHFSIFSNRIAISYIHSPCHQCHQEGGKGILRFFSLANLTDLTFREMRLFFSRKGQCGYCG